MSLLDYFDSRDKKERMSYVLNLFAVAAADGHIDSSEQEIIFNIAARHGLTTAELERILKRPESISFTPPATDRARIEQLIDMVLVMMVDGEIDAREYALCKLMAKMLGFRHEVIDAMIIAVIEAIKKKIRTELAIEQLLKMM